MKNNRHIIIFVSILVIASIITGYIYGINNYYDLTEYIKQLTTHNNQFLPHIAILCAFLFSTISLAGIIFEVIYIGFESISIGYLLAIFYSNFKFKGIIFSLAVIGINKLFFLIILFYLFYVSCHYIRKSIRNILGMNKDYIEVVTKPLLLKYAIMFGFLIIYDLFVYLFGNNILNYLTFML